MPSPILVIDPESAGLDLIAELDRRGAAVTTWTQRTPFVQNVDGTKRPDADLIEMAGAGGFSAVVPGGESGVSAAEWLSAHLRLPGSDPEYIFHRRDKDGMVSRVRDAGIDAARSVLVRNSEDIAAAIEHTGLPAVLKPANSAGSDLVRVVPSLPDANSHAESIFGSTSILGIENQEVVVQEYLDGPQFHINTVVIDGEHLVTEVYSDLFRMIDGAPQLYAGRTYRLDDPRIVDVVSYTLRCMEALGVRQGSSHSEVRVTSRGPILVEFNGRLMGPCQPTDYFVSAQGYSQATVWADVLTGEISTAREAIVLRDPRATLGFYMLSAANAGRLIALDESALRDLPSYRGIYNAPAIGDEVTIENRTTTAEIGLILLADTDAGQVDRDIEAIAELEASGAIHVVSI